MGVHRRRPERRADPSLRSGLAIRQPGLRPGRAKTPGSPARWAPRGDCLRQRRRRELLRDPQERARPPPLLADQARARRRGVRLHRDLLQPPAPTLHPRRCSRRPIRLFSLRKEALVSTLSRTRKPPAKKTNQTVSSEPGEVQRERFCSLSLSLSLSLRKVSIILLSSAQTRTRSSGRPWRTAADYRKPICPPSLRHRVPPEARIAAAVPPRCDSQTWLSCSG